MKIRIIFIIILSSLFITEKAQAQGQANNWYFGDYAGITFNSGSPALLSGSGMTILEGCASISDADGDLLFYTDGMKVWNSNNIIMSNGLGLLGDPSSTQSAVIVPQPSNADKFFIFTVDACQNGLANGMNYSIVDMTEGGGLGAVTTKNVHLQDMVAEKISAVLHYNNRDIWVITHGYHNNNFYSYLITADGLQDTPVISSTGSIHTGSNDPYDMCGETGSSRGYIKASPDGKRLALAITKSDLVESFKFNNQTGGLRFENSLSIIEPYGVEFSPDGSKMYISTWMRNGTSKLYQFDLNNSNNQVELGSSNFNNFGSVQVGPDEKVYVSHTSTSLGAIASPNEAGTACNYNASAINLGAMSNFGLPTFIQSYFFTPQFAFENICFGETTNFTIGTTTDLLSVSWDFDDPASGTANTSSIFSPSHVYSSAGEYEVELITSFVNGQIDTVVRVVNIYNPTVDLGEDRILCGSGLLDAGAGFASYLWSDDSETRKLFVNTSGTYSVEITDVSGCTATDEVVITVHPKPEFTSIITNNGCNSQNNGFVTLSGSSGLAPYEFSLDNATFTTDPVFVNLAPGNYSAYIQDDRGCVNSQAFTILNPPAIRSTVVSTPVTCFGGNDGAINLTPLGGTPDYTFEWSNTEITEDISGLVTGNYTITITDANNCTMMKVIEVETPDSIKPNFAIENLKCKGDTIAQIEVLPSGGTAGYSFLWGDGETTALITDLTSGSYTVQITDDAGCVESFDTEIYEPYFYFDVNNTKIYKTKCHGGEDGVIDLTMSGGTVPYSFEWSNGDFIEDADSLPAGTYEVLVTDAFGCVVDSAFTITEPAVMLATTIDYDNVLCTGTATGSANLLISGGDAPYQVLWSNSVQNELNNELVAGQYFVSVADTNGCVVQDSVTISEPADSLVLSLTKTDIVCYDSLTATIDLTITGGITDYSFLWSNGATTEDMQSVGAGKYTVIVTDLNGCQKADSIIVEQPQFPIQINNLIQNNITCFGFDDGAIALDVSGGTAPYDLLWNTNDTISNIDTLTAGFYSLHITDANGCNTDTTLEIIQPTAPLSLAFDVINVDCRNNNSAQIDMTVLGGTPNYNFSWSNGAVIEDLVNLEAGKYYINLEDDYGCTIQDSVEITQPEEVFSVISLVDNVLCHDENSGNISLELSGGTLPYSVNWNNGETSEILSDLVTGTYIATIVDANLCEIDTTIYISQPQFELSVINIETQNVLCHGTSGGSIEMSLVGGTSPYTFLWSNNETSEDIDTLFAGTYSIVATDANGCLLDTSFILSEPPTAMQLSLAQTNVDCHGVDNGTIDLTVVDGNSPYSFLWSNGAMTEDLTDLSPGVFEVVVTDDNECEAVVSTEISASIQITATEIPVSCIGRSDGGLDVSVSGGNPGYTFVWSDGTTVTEDITSLPAGHYSIEVTDNSGCTEVQDFIVTQPDYELNISNFDLSNINCRNGSDGQIDIDVFGGTSPYNFEWSNNDTEEVADSLSIGTFSVVVTDERGCQTQGEYLLTEPDSIVEVAFAPNEVLCHGDATGTIDLSVVGGIRPYNYLWSNDAETQDINGLESGVYTVVVTDDNGCILTDSIEVFQPNAAIEMSFTKIDLVCTGDTVGSVDLTVVGGVSPYGYLWSNDAETEDLFHLTAGVYMITITDQNNCVAIDSVVIEQPAFGLDFTNFSSTNVDCFGNETGSIEPEVSGGVEPYNYIWSNGVENIGLENISEGDYELSITDVNGCTLDTLVQITQPETALEASLSVLDNVCFGANEGEIILEIDGGTPDYQILWSNGSTEQNQSGLSSDDYNVTITDLNGCVVEQETSLVQPNNIEIEKSIVDVRCNGGNDGSITINITGGVPQYSSLWSNSSTAHSLENLVAGEYSLIVTDENGCIKNDTVVITEPFEITTEFEFAISCSGDTDGIIDMGVFGGTQPYAIVWSNHETTEDLSELSQGEYHVSITDINNCLHEASVMLLEPDPLVLNTIVVDASCEIKENGSIELAVQGGTEPYIYAWSNNSDEPKLEDLAAGIYSITITDAHNCQTSKDVHINLLFDACVETFNSFSPNDDGVNDVWMIEGIDLFPDATIQVFDRYGKLLVSYRGDDDPWDGTFGGGRLPLGTYYYVININHAGVAPVSGSVTIIR